MRSLSSSLRCTARQRRGRDGPPAPFYAGIFSWRRPRPRHTPRWTGCSPKAIAVQGRRNCWWGARRLSSSGFGTTGPSASRTSWCATSPVTTSRCCAPSRSSVSTSCPPCGLCERVLKLGGSWGTKIYSAHTMTGKQLPCLGIAGDGGVAHVHHRVLDISVSQPVLHKSDIRASVQQVHRNRVAQRMKTPLGLRNVRHLAILLHQVPIGPAFQGDASGGD